MVREYSPQTRSDSSQRHLPPLESGDRLTIIRSQVFPGLWLAVEALLNNQMVRVLEVVQAGLKSPEHTAFVQQLKK